MRINKHDTNGTKPLLGKGELGYDDYTAGGDTGRVYVGNGASNIALAKKSEVDAKVVANAGITAGTATKVTYDAKGLVTSGTTLSAGDIPVLDAGKITTGTLPVARGGTGVTTVTGTGSVVLNTSPALVTPNIGIAIGTSFNSITGLASVNPIIAGVAAVGTSTLTARQDHVHPVQTSVSGNAGTATKLATARTINGVSFDGSANITIVDSTKLPLSGGTMTGAITAIRETKVAMAANNIDLATGNLFTKTISGVTTLTISNALAADNVNSFVLELTNGGSAVVTWFSGVKWAGGTAPTLTASGKDILGFYSHDGGTTWNILGVNKDVK